MCVVYVCPSVSVRYREVSVWAAWYVVYVDVFVLDYLLELLCKCFAIVAFC